MSLFILYITAVLKDLRDLAVLMELEDARVTVVQLPDVTTCSQ